MQIPSNNIWTQTNEGKQLGVLGDTFNIDLETPGQLSGAKKSVAYLHEYVFTNMTYPLAVVYYAGDYIVVTSDEAYKFSLITLTGSTISGYPAGVAVNSDAVVCYNRLYISLDTNIDYWDGSSWTNGVEAITTGLPHPLEVFDSQTTYKLAVGNGNKVYLIDSSGNKYSTELTLPNQFRVTTLRYRNGYLYVGTRNIYGGEARVFLWNGSGANAQYEVSVGANWVFSMTAYKGSVACITDKGQLLYINGSSSEELAALPIYYEKNTRWQNHLGLQLNGKVFNRGMEVVGDSIYINIDGEVDVGECLKMKSGLWIYNPKVGLYHHAQASNDRMRSDASISVSNSEITTSGTHYLKTGDAVVFTNITGLTGVTRDKTYYAYVTSATKLKLATSRTALQAGNYITIGGSVSSETFMYAQNRDQGVRNHTSGAIGRIVSEERVPTLFAGDIMYGALVEDLDGVGKYTLQILIDAYNVSRFSTQRIYSDNISQVWKESYAFIDGIKNDGESVIVKSRAREDRETGVITGTWLTTTTINCSASDQDVTVPAVGDEIIITDGYGRGYSTVITEINNSSTVYSFTVEDSLGTINGAVSFYSKNFKKLDSFNNSRIEDEYVKASCGDEGKSAWIQLEYEMRGFSPDINKIELTNSVDKSAV